MTRSCQKWAWTLRTEGCRRRRFPVGYLDRGLYKTFGGRSATIFSRYPRGYLRAGRVLRYHMRRQGKDWLNERSEHMKPTDALACALRHRRRDGRRARQRLAPQPHGEGTAGRPGLGIRRMHPVPCDDGACAVPVPGRCRPVALRVLPWHVRRDVLSVADRDDSSSIQEFMPGRCDSVRTSHRRSRPRESARRWGASARRPSSTSPRR